MISKQLTKFHSLCYFLLLALLSSCNTAPYLFDRSFQEGDYQQIVESNNKLVGMQDTVLKFVSYLKVNDITNAERLYAEPMRYSIIGNWSFNRDSADVVISINSYPFSIYSSEELFMHGMYYDLKYSANYRVLDRFLRESLKKDSDNIYALYELARLNIYGGNYGRSIVLLDHLLELVPDQKRAKRMLRSCKEQKYYSVDLKWSLNGVLNEDVIPLDYHKDEYLKWY